MENKKLSEINYQPLDYMNHAWDAVIKEKFKVRPWIFWVVVAIISIGLGYLVIQMGIYFPLLVYGYVASKVLNHKATIWKKFAEANGWTVFGTAYSGDPRWVPPSLYGYGHSDKIGDIVHAQFEDHDCDVFMYQFMTGSGKSRQTHYYTIARVMLDRPFPHLILDSKHSRAIKDRNEATDSAKLEGNFPNHFSLYFSKNDHINALSIITPDVMQTLLESNAFQDIEIVDNYLYFMIHSDIRNPGAIPILFQSVDKLADQIKHKAKTMQFKPAISSEARYLMQATIKSSQSADKMMAYIVMGAFIIIGIPIIFLLGIGIFTSVYGN